MALAEFSIIVATDSCYGISKDGEIPWKSRSAATFFRETTMGRGRNAVIMGRVTYEKIPPEVRPLEGRYCVVISRTWNQTDHPEVTVCSTLLDALILIGGTRKSYDEVIIAGGEQLYHEALDKFMYLCKRVYVTKFKTDYSCDQFFPWDAVSHYGHFKDVQKTRDFTRYCIAPNVQHQENQYLNSLETILEKGTARSDRTGTGTVSVFGLTMEYDISTHLPVITTKKINYENVIKELLFFVSGSSDAKKLSSQGVKIWDANTSREALDRLDLHEYEEGDMGPMYGHQWRHWNAPYEGADKNYNEMGIDQLEGVIESIKTDPFSRRHIISTWNVEQLSEMCLNPCHVLCQFYVSSDRKTLDCMLYQRSADMFLGVPYNIVSYSILTYMVAHLTNLKPGRFIHTIGDAHIYSTHVNAVKKQLGRTPQPQPTMRFRGATRIHEIDDFKLESFIIEDYSSWPHISGKMAV